MIMGLWHEVEHAAQDAARVGQDTVSGVGGMLESLHALLAGASLGNVARELEELAHQANRLRGQLAAAADATQWTGSAAEGFRQRARRREQQLGELVRALDEARSAVAAAYAVAGIF
jgi:uncharacterized protein YukE